MKRGALHLEMIISFGIFVGLVAFIFLYVNPVGENKIPPKNILILLKDNFLELGKTDVIILFLNSSVPCSPLDILNGGVDIIDQGRYYIILSQEITNLLPNCSINPGSGNFTIGSVRKKDVLSNKKLEQIKSKYYTNYSGLMKDLSLQEKINFEVISEGYELKRESEESFNILAKSYKTNVLYTDGTIEEKEFIFRIW